ncbi:MAG: energy transducer TonB [Candidatus Omnitrophica bacterium]|nr:energy transducer TonB [Candidatus Omnitrophota bacterium]
MSSVFKICLSISILAHAAVIVPHIFMPRDASPVRKEITALNYIVIEDPCLASQEEVLGNKCSESNAESIADNAPRLGEDPAGLKQKDVEESSSSNPKSEESKFYSGKQEAFLEYFNLVREKIRGQMHNGFGRNEPGSVTLIFTLEPSGRLRDVNFETEKITSFLRSKVAKSLDKAEPFPPFPKELGRESIDFSLTIRFK